MSIRSKTHISFVRALLTSPSALASHKDCQIVQHILNSRILPEVASIDDVETKSHVVSLVLELACADEEDVVGDWALGILGGWIELKAKDEQWKRAAESAIQRLINGTAGDWTKCIRTLSALMLGLSGSIGKIVMGIAYPLFCEVSHILPFVSLSKR